MSREKRDRQTIETISNNDEYTEHSSRDPGSTALKEYIPGMDVSSSVDPVLLK